MRRESVAEHAAIVAVGVLMVLLFCEVGLAQNYEQTYFLLKESTTYRLNLSITTSLYQYYQEENHQLTQSNFASFVTPYSLAPVAADVRQVFPEEEEFANAVLMFVHQIPYQTAERTKYPVETLVENRGDCDLLSYVAASLIKSQSLGVVLFYFEQESHMNIGVSLSHPPKNARTDISYVDHDGNRYYMAECTGGNWRVGWKVGELPPELEEAQVEVITLENSEMVAPGQVSSSFDAVESSFISLMTSSNFVMEESIVTINGRVSALNPMEPVNVYALRDKEWFTIGTAELDSRGCYTFSWNPPTWGLYYVKASWPGNDLYAGADSRTVSIYVVPKSLLIVGGGLILIIIAAAAILLLHRSTHPHYDTRGFETEIQ